MAADLISSFTAKWKPDRYRDTYRDRLLDVIEQKRKGKDVHAEAVREPEAPTDLVEAVRASVEAAKRERKARSSGMRGRSTNRKSSRRKPSRR